MQQAKFMNIPESQAKELIEYSKIPPSVKKEENKLKARSEKYNLKKV